MLTIVGGTYLEVCRDPESFELYGSGLRAASALANKGFEVYFKSNVGKDQLDAANLSCKTYGINASFELIPNTITFDYYHPLSPPDAYPISESKHSLSETIADNILFYGQIESNTKVCGTYVVYDPQNWHSFKSTGSTAEHLALVLNRKEAYLLSDLPSGTALIDVGNFLLSKENAEVVIIKNGSEGALVIETGRYYEIPVYETETVWPIGSGDIFTAAFAWKWIIEKMHAANAALLASQYTAYYCNTRVLPLPKELEPYKALPKQVSPKKVYLAGPFFTISERWLVEELRLALQDFDNQVFSPYHDVGTDKAIEEIVRQDLIAIQDSDVVLAVINGLDAGTQFEIGYARALEKKVVVLAENVKENDLTMLIGSGCIITNDLSTAVYKASW